MEPILPNDRKFSLRFYIYGHKWWTRPIICKNPRELIQNVEDAMGESEVNEDIFIWAQSAPVGSMWDEDDMYIVVI